jgi:hypothetical protein
MADPINTVRHIVKSGETLGQIAKDNHVRVEDILAVNPSITDRDKIFAGQSIFIPTQGSGTGPQGPPAEGPPATGEPIAAGAILSGMDANLPLTNQVACLKAEGFRFAVRYYTRKDRNRTLTLLEAQTLVKGGFQLGVVFEDGFPSNPAEQPAFFTHDRGVGDGRAAHDRALNKIGQPANTPIYFGVDFDASPHDLATGIKRYFEGVREALLAANNGTLKYQIGVYGSGLACTELLKNGLATFAWLSQSTGHRGSKEFKKQKLYNLVQGPVRKNVCGLDEIDSDETNPDPIKFPPGLFTIAV